MESVGQDNAGSSIAPEDLMLSGGELILAVARAFEGSFSEKPDLSKLNLLLFLMEGDGGIRSDLLFYNSQVGPKSQYLQNFVADNQSLLRVRTYGKAPRRELPDPDVRKRVELTAEGRRIADTALSSLPDGDLRRIARILSKWGRESHPEILTYVCMFYGNFCSAMDRREDPNSLSRA